MARVKFYQYITPENAIIDPTDSGKSIGNITKDAEKKVVRKKDLPPSNAMIGFYKGITAYYYKGKYVFATRINEDGDITSIV